MILLSSFLANFTDSLQRTNKVKRRKKKNKKDKKNVVGLYNKIEPDKYTERY